MSLPSPISDDSSPTSVEIAGDVRRTLVRSMDSIVREWRTLLAQVEKKQQGYVPPGERDDLASMREFTRSAIDTFERIGRGDPARLDHLTPPGFSWFDITAEIRRDEAAGWSLWEKIRQTARDELAGGVMAGQAVEGYQARPYERATFLAIREALADGLQPRNGMERLLLDGMAEAWVMHLRWLSKHVKTDSMDAGRLDGDIGQQDGWEPPRLSEAEAVDRAAQMSDRFQRQFLRLMKCYRDGRRLIGSMTVVGGQVNLAGQQIVTTGDERPEFP